MTNIIATIILTITTNWTSVGTFTPNTPKAATTNIIGSGVFDVQEGRLQTNTIAHFDMGLEPFDVILRTNLGPVVAERKIEKPVQVVFGQGLSGVIPVPGPAWQTNWINFGVGTNWMRFRDTTNLILNTETLEVKPRKWNLHTASE